MVTSYFIFIDILFLYFLCRLVTFYQAWKNKGCANSILRGLMLVGYFLPYYVHFDNVMKPDYKFLQVVLVFYYTFQYYPYFVGMLS